MEHVEVAIVGAGFGGLGTAVALDRAGIRDWRILERASSIGGTWRDNVYPGAACDVPSPLYSFSFALEPGWSHRYARGPEIRAYLEDCADRFGLRDRIRLGAEVIRASWSEDGWTLELGDGGRLRARFVVFGVGGLRDPKWPELPGLDGFAGTLAHSARWPAGLSVDGQRVGLVGTGASAIQIGPELAKTAGRLTVFQRTAPWVTARNDRAYRPWEQALRRRVPAVMKAERAWTWARMESRYPLFFGRLHRFGRLGEVVLRGQLRRALKDPGLADRATPGFRLGCKRILASDDWYPMLTRANVALETSAIARVLPDGVELADGRRVALDVLVCCTGFQVDRPLGSLSVVGRDGLELATFWGSRPRAWLGITAPGFPDAFVLLGPNTALGHSSVVLMIEAQVRYLVQGIQHARQTGRPLDLRPDALDRFVAEIDRAHASRVWTTGCASWYQNAEGAQFALWPGSTARYLWRTRRFDPSVYNSGRGDGLTDL